MSTTYPIKDKSTLEQFKTYYLEKNSVRNYALIILGLNTALRIGDILALQWKDVYNFEKDIYRRHISIHEQKTGKENSIAINGAVSDSLDLLLAKRKSSGRIPEQEDYIFISNKGKKQPITRYQAYRIIREAAFAAGVEEHISCHSLRKTFGYYAWRQGVPPAMLMNIYNHSSYQITKRYLCIEQEDRDDVFMKINI